MRRGLIAGLVAFLTAAGVVAQEAPQESAEITAARLQEAAVIMNLRRQETVQLRHEMAQYRQIAEAQMIAERAAWAAQVQGYMDEIVKMKAERADKAAAN